MLIAACHSSGVEPSVDIMDGAGPCREEATSDGGAPQEPYIAAIVAPYVRTSHPLQSQMSWFRVEHPSGRLPPGVPSPSRISQPTHTHLD